MKGFLSSVGVAFAVALLAFAFASLEARESHSRAVLLGFESQVVHGRASDAALVADASFKDALVDAGYASAPCEGASEAFCTGLSKRFNDYLVLAKAGLSEGVVTVNYSATVSCEPVVAPDEYANSFYASYELVLLANSTLVSEHRVLANSSFVDVNLALEEPALFSLRLRSPADTVYHEFGFACG
ncbi:MAG: hypothetical protein WC607_03890 [Candidatus Micrarchaeia archaeon]